jgi:CubicO group peptidase (beta-lactamase class C family)
MHVNGVEWAMARRPAAATTNEYLANEFHMALFGKFWDRVAPPRQAIRLDAGRSAQIDDYVRGQVGTGGPGLAVAIVKSGTCVHAAGYGLADMRRRMPIEPDTIFHMASCGKQITGIGILMLAEAGKLGLDDPISRHLPSLAGFGPKVTIRQLLHHTSGIRDLYDESGMEEVLSRCERPANDDIVRTYVDLGCPMAKPGIEPGDEFVYSNSGYDLLGTLIEHVSGQSYHDFFESRVFNPLGMKDTFTAPDRRLSDRRVATGYAAGDVDGDFVEYGGSDYDDLVGSGSFYTTVSDLCLYDKALATNALVNAASMQLALTSGRTNDGALTDYGFGWYIGVYEGMRFVDHDGLWIGFHSYICRYLDPPLSIFILSNHPDLDIVEVANLATAVYR